MIAFLIIALIFMILMPCALFFKSIDEFFEKTKEKKLSKTEKKRKDEKKILENQIKELKEENLSYCSEIEKINQKLLETEEKEEHIKNLENKISETNNLLLDYQKKEEDHKNKCDKDWRLLYPKYFRCKDGEYVRSKAEREIDNFLYENRIWHIYEYEYKYSKNKRPIYPDFYLQDYNLFIEYFGLDNQKYEEKEKWKIDIYKSNKNIKFEYLTYKDDGNIYEKLKEICIKYSIPMK